MNQKSKNNDNSILTKEVKLNAWVAILCAIIAGGPGWFTLITGVNETFEKNRIESLVNVIHGTQKKGANDVDGEVDGIYSFIHDPHIYYFNWQNLKIIKRNLIGPIQVYGDDNAVKLSDKLYMSFEVVTSAFERSGKMQFSDGIQEIGTCFQIPMDKDGKRILSWVLNNPIEKRECFKNSEENYLKVLQFAATMNRTIKCQANALKEALISNARDEKREIIHCEESPYILKRSEQGILIQPRT